MSKDFNTQGTETGRTQTSVPNQASEPRSQNIRIRTSLGDKLRKAFKEKEEKDLRPLNIDYAELELRLIAHTQIKEKSNGKK